jgi:uncharacterized repeat protein (TIGR01451 family)
MNSNIRRLLVTLTLGMGAVLGLLALGLTMTQARIQSSMDMNRITIASNTDRDSRYASLNADGTLIAFSSDSDLLGQGIPNDQFEIWLYDTTTLTYTRVTTSPYSDRSSLFPKLSADGTKVAFSGDADFFGPGIPQYQYEAWLYDVATQALTRLTTSSGSDRSSSSESISADGTIVALASDSDFFGQGIADEQWEIWLYDTTTMTYTRITTASESNRQSWHPRMNADGTLLAFSSDSDFFGEGIEDEQFEIWLYDIPSGELTRVTHAPDSSRGSHDPYLSADGTSLAFYSDVDFFGQGIAQYQNEVWLYDVASGELTRVTTASDSDRTCSYVTLNADGTRVAFRSNSDFLGQGIPYGESEIWLYDVNSDTFTRVTTVSAFDRFNRQPSLSTDGTKVVFQSDSDFLGQGIPSAQYEIWLFGLPGPAPSLVKTVDDESPRPGQRITFTLSVVNPLTTTLTNAVISDTLPPELVLAGPVTLDPPQSGAVLADDPGDLPTLASGLTVSAKSVITLAFPVTVSEGVGWGTVITNTAGLTSTQTPMPALGSVVLHVLFHVTGTDPVPNSHDASLDTDLFFTANSAVSATSVTTETVVVHGGFQGRLDGDFSFGSVTFDPASDLHPGELVQVSVTDGVLNGDGEPVVPHVWEFRAATLGGSSTFITHPVTSTLSVYYNYGVALGDLDRDGDLDAVLANGSSRPETVWLNDGTGGLSLHPTTPAFGGGDSRDVTLGDLDGDGDLDVVVTNALTNTVWLNDGGGNFSAHPTTPNLEANSSAATALGDLDGDGDLDAIVANYVSDTVWLNDGAGNLALHSSTPDLAGGGSQDVDLGDLDGDGDLDAVVATGGYIPQVVRFNDGAGNFTALGGFDSSSAARVALGDLDGDGDLDAVLAKFGQPQTMWLNDGRGHFSPHPTTPSFGAGDSRDVVLGDLDGDGDLDAVVANENSQPQTVWLNDGAGNLTAHPDSPDFGGGRSQNIALGDLDGDGDLDAIVGDNSDFGTTVWLNGIPEYKVYLPLVIRQ